MLAIQDRTKRRNLNEEITLLDRRLGPDGGHYLFLRNDVASSVDQRSQQIERAPSDRDPRESATVVTPEQPAASAVEPKIRKQKNIG